MANATRTRKSEELTPRPLDLDALHLKSGAHSGPDSGYCFMEAAAYIAGEPWSDHPVCVCPVIAAFGRKWNDDLDEAGRQRLKRFIPLVLDTRSTEAVESARAWLATDWLVRVHTPAWLRLAKLEEQAQALEALRPLTSAAIARESQSEIGKAQTAAGTAARDAAWTAAWTAARRRQGRRLDRRLDRRRDRRLGRAQTDCRLFAGFR